MVITSTSAKLWFDTKEEEKDYDDLMMANIEFQETENDQSNYFTTVFVRSKKEKFFDLKDNVKNQIFNFVEGNKDKSVDEFIDTNYNVSKRLDSMLYWREFGLEKSFLSFPLAYLFLRELPIRNFYARSLIMVGFYVKFFDIWGHIIPFVTQNGPVMIKDDLTNLQVNNYINLVEANEIKVIPNKNNKISDYRKWNAVQPGFLDDRYMFTALNGLDKLLGESKQDHFWDGTMNQPVIPLSDPQHRKAKTLWLK